MPAFVWIALAVFLVLLVAGCAYLGVNAARAWRRARPIVQRLASAAGELQPKVATVERRVTDLEPRVAALQHSVTRLNAAIARAKLQLDVLLEVKSTFDLARAVLRFR